jgi:hypothetical protein
MSLSLAEFDPACFSFGDGIQRIISVGYPYTVYPALYNGRPLSLKCTQLLTRSGIQPTRTRDARESVGRHCIFHVDENLRVILQAIHQKAQAVNPQCRNPIYNDDYFPCKVPDRLPVGHRLQTCFCADVCVTVPDLILTNNICKIRFLVKEVANIITGIGAEFLINRFERVPRQDNARYKLVIPKNVQDSEGNEENCCVVCLLSKSCMQLSPCLHTCLCIVCSQTFQTNNIYCCPLCRGEIDRIAYV